MCTSDTPPAAHPTAELSLALIGRRASVGGSVDRADWWRVFGAVDNPPGGVWIAFIRRTLEDSQSIVAVTVTGSLVSSYPCSAAGTPIVLIEIRYFA